MRRARIAAPPMLVVDNRIIAHVVVELHKSTRPPAGGFCNLTMTLTSQ